MEKCCVCSLKSVNLIPYELEDDNLWVCDVHHNDIFLRKRMYYIKGHTYILESKFSWQELETNSYISIDEKIYDEIKSYKYDQKKIYKFATLLALVDYYIDLGVKIPIEVDVSELVLYFAKYILDDNVLEYCFKSERNIINNRNKNFNSTKKFNNMILNKMRAMPIRHMNDSTFFRSDDLYSTKKIPKSQKKSNDTLATKVWIDSTINLNTLIGTIKLACFHKITDIIGDTSICDQKNKTRNGQANYRNQLIVKFHGQCAICGESHVTMLRASHAMPYARCSNDHEKYSPNNGLLLCANHDSMFDRGEITFDQNGNIIVSNNLSERDDLIDKKIIVEQLMVKYLKYHKEHVYKHE